MNFSQKSNLFESNIGSKTGKYFFNKLIKSQTFPRKLLPKTGSENYFFSRFFQNQKTSKNVFAIFFKKNHGDQKIIFSEKNKNWHQEIYFFSKIKGTKNELIK